MRPGEFWPEPDEDDEGEGRSRQRDGGGGKGGGGRGFKSGGRRFEQVASPRQALEAIKSLTDA